MADGNLGSLFMSLDIKDETGTKLRKVAQNIQETENRINSLQKSINDSSKELHKLSEGSSAWQAQKENIRGMVSEINNLVGALGAYRKEFNEANQKMVALNSGKLVTPHQKITSLLDTKPIEEQIEKLERFERILKHIQDLQSKKNDISLDAQGGLGGMHAWETYQKRIQDVDNQIAKAKDDLKSLGGEGFNLNGVRSQIDSLYTTLVKFEKANDAASTSVKNNVNELSKHLAKQKEVEAAFGPLLAAQRRAAQQEAANRANIEATNAARQKQVQVLREQATAMLQNKLNTLKDQRGQIAGVYFSGKEVGLSAAELENIRLRYQEISREILNIQSLLQNSKGLSYNELFSAGRNIGSAGNFASDAAQKVARLRAEAEAAARATQDNARASKELASAFRQAHDAASKTSSVISDIKSLLLQGGIVYGAQQFANSIIQTGGEIAQQHIALRNIIGDARKADELFAQTQKLALESPFKFGELNRDVKQLAAFGVEADSLYDTTKRLADVASGLGVSFERLGLAYGQVKSRSWLDGKELRQFAYAGLPLLQKITDLYNETGKNGKNNYTTKDIRDMITKREVSFDDVDSVIKKLTDEGGQFYNMQYVLSDTLLGRWNKLIDAWDIMLAKFADGKSIVGGFFMTAINGAVTLVQSIDKFGPILLAAFSGFALRKFSTMLGGSLAGNLLYSKQALAAKYQEKALNGELSAEEQRILNTKRQITAEDLKILAASRAITSADLQRAYVSGKITTEQYKQISGILAQQRQTVTLAARFGMLKAQISGMFTAGFWQNFGTRGLAAFNLLKAGAVSLGTTLWTAIGGLPGLLITGATMLFASLMQSDEELKQVADSIAQSAKQVYDDLRKYIEDNPINVRASVSDLAEQINKEKETLKEKVGSGYDSIIIDVNAKANGDPSKQLEYLRQYTELYARAAEKAQAMKSVMADAEEASKGLFRESIQTNLEDLEKSAQKLSLTTSKMSMAQLVKEADELKSKSGVSSDFKKFADIILEANKNGLTLDQTLSKVKDTALNMSSISFRGSYGTDISKFVVDAAQAAYDSRNLDANITDFAKSFSKQFENLAKSPTEQALYRVLKDGWKNANNLDVVQGAYFDMKLDKAMGLKEFPSLAEDMAKDAASRITESTRQILASGQPLTKAAQDDIRKATNKAMEHFRATWPGNADEIQRMISSRNFSFNVMMHVVGDKSVTQGVLDDFYLGKPKYSGNSILLRSGYQGSHPTQFSTNGNAYYKQWSNGGSSPDEVEKKAKEAVDKSLETYNSAVRQRGKTASKAYYDALTEVRAAFKEVIGYSYAGEATGITKKNNTREAKARKAAETAKRNAERAAEKAKRAEERRQREILKGWQSQKKLLEDYYETWNKWRAIEGEADAKSRLRNDKRFSKLDKSKYNDPEALSKNLSKMVAGYEKIAKTEEQRNFLVETRAETAKKEADIELKSAERHVEILREQLDLISKQYETYQRLLKVSPKSFASDFTFGPYGKLYADEGSYYKYLKDRLTNIDSRKPTAKGFVNNNMSATDKVNSLDEVTVVSSLKKVDFGPEGLEGVLRLSNKDIEERFGEKSKLTKLILDLKKEQDNLDSKIVDSLTTGLERLNDYKSEIDSINASYDEQIERLKERNALNEDNEKYLSDEALKRSTTVLNQQRNRDIQNVNLKELKNSAAYYNFFGAITTLSTSEAERYGAAIRDIVNKAFSSGAIDAREYAKQLKQIDDQMEKLNNQHSDFLTYLQGGLDGLIQKYKEKGAELSNRGSNEAGAGLQDLFVSQFKGDWNGVAKAQERITAANSMKASGDAMSQNASKMKSTVSVIDTIVNGINNAVQSMKKFVDQIADDFDTLGKGGDGIRDSKGYQFVSGFSEASQGAADGWNSLKNGNIMGAVTGVYRSFSGWFTGTARARDAKLDRQIQLAERQLKALNNLQNSIERNLQKTLGGVYGYKADKDDIAKIKEGLDNYSLAKKGATYGHDTRLASKAIGTGAGIAVGAGSAALAGAVLGSAVGPIGTAIGAAAGAIVGFVVGGLFGHKKKTHSTVYSEETNKAMQRAYETQTYYDQQFAVMNMQLDQTKDKIKKEQDKKKSDESKINDYKSQVAELDSNIKSFALDMAKKIYDIDLKSWAKELTNAIVDAWSKGEDAAKAYYDKVKDLMKNLALNIITQKIMEQSLKGVSDLIANKMKNKSGLLDATDILDLANMIEKECGTAIENVMNVLDVLKSKGLDLSGKGSSSVGNGIKSITENTADVLSSYINAIRLDVSVDRVNIQRIADAMASMPQMSDIANSQLAELRIISINTQKNAENTERILTLFRDITTPGLKKVNIH